MDRAAGPSLAFYAFPTVRQLALASEAELREAGFGYGWRLCGLVVGHCAGDAQEQRSIHNTVLKYELLHIVPVLGATKAGSVWVQLRWGFRLCGILQAGCRPN